MDTNKDIINDELIEGIVEKQAIVRDFKNSRMTKTAFVKSRGLSRSTFYRYLTRGKEGAKGYIDKRKRRPKKGIKIDDRYTEIILSFLVDHPQAPITAIHTELGKQGSANGWGTPPTYDKVRRFCRSISSDVLVQWSQGRKERIESKSLTIRRVVTTVNALWQCDFSEIPFWTFDPAFGPELFKPWLVGTICCASRVVPGTLVCKTVGSAEIVACWRKAMMAKGTPTYPFYGVPTVVSMDNHKAFQGDAWQSLMALGVEPFFINNDSPEENGKQERWFWTMQTKLFSHLEGFADQHQGKDKAKKKCIPYPLLQRLVDDFVLEYHLTEHSTLQMTPWEAWHRGLADANGLLVPTTDIDRSLRVSREVKVSPEGVQVNNRKFTGAFLEGRVDQTLTVRFAPGGPGDTVTVYDHGLYLGEASEHITTELAAEISTTRLERTIEIASLAKRIRERNEQAAPVIVPESAASTPPTEAIAAVKPFKEADPTPTDDEDNLGTIPELPSTEATKDE
jgi:ACT domain-containing protein